MGVSKSSFFTEEQNELASKLKALAHPARIAIVQYILKQKKCICTNIVEELPLAQPTISQHLKELKSSGIIKGSIEGKGICYCVDEENLSKTIANLQEILNEMKLEKDACC